MNDGLTPGTRIQVRNRFDGSWSSSPFEVAEAIEPTPTELPRYRVRCLSDGVVCPPTSPATRSARTARAPTSRTL